MTKTKIFKTALVLLYGISTILADAAENPGENEMRRAAQQYIDNFRRGVTLRPDETVGGLVINGRIDKSALSLLTKELSTGTPEVRENIVALLEKIGLELDHPASPDKFPIIRDHSIIRALLVEGFAKTDSAAQAAGTIVRDRCKPSDLSAFNDLYIESLRQSSGVYLYIAAKAKTIQARPLVENLAKSPDWQKYDDRAKIIKIAQAALGNTAVEDEFIEAAYAAEKNAPPAPKNRFYDVGTAKEGKEVAARLGSLGLIGTRRSLSVVCTYLRSPLKAYVPNISERSVRYAALDAILYNFPDERVLSHPTTVAEWAAAERFCTDNLGTTFDGPTPDLPTDRPYPTRLNPGGFGSSK